MSASVAALSRLSLKRVVPNRALCSGSAFFLAHRAVNLPHRNSQCAGFSTTPRRLAVEDSPEKVIAETQRKFTSLLLENPELQRLLGDLKTILEDEGINVMDTEPSKMQVFRLMMKPHVRDAVMKAAVAFQEAGMDPKEVMQQLMELQKAHDQSSKE
ncbi:hypothetical protein WOLCODRAFT_137495 [Wolfiporia cocos MD-104 SS10]|uniref:Uncharacterized protein n=1 Tax=Wolfiporia cocos (strain MD-104) TaxID=742152 RepID=A0A2H3JUT8_WOLCO|nr:hypothetical protein WOLCODRAFT_137495 [Wolfiporia cocos MD-104 SS10]